MSHSPIVHEIAILGDRSWVGREAGRSRFARELARRATRGRAAGLEISTLLLRDAELDDHLDLVVKQGVSAIAGQPPVRRQSWLARPQTAVMQLRFGLYRFATQAAVPDKSSWFSLGAGRRARRAIDAAIAHHDVCHLHFDSLAIAAEGRPAIRRIQRLLGHVQRRSEQGGLWLGTLAATVNRLSGGQQSTPARSILRPAA
jgi:hypothetical protein